jgi:hypothetical protein
MEPISDLKHVFLILLSNCSIASQIQSPQLNHPILDDHNLSPIQDTWAWQSHQIGWSLMGDPTAPIAVLLIHGFGANTNHWRFNQPVLAKLAPPMPLIYSASAAVINRERG